MFKNIPEPLKRQFWKMILTAAGIVVIGLTWSIATKDSATMRLTIVLLLAYTTKAWTMLKDIVEGKYLILEGIVISVVDIPLHRQQSITLVDEDQIVLRLSGRRHFAIGERYRFYLQNRSVDRFHSPIKIPQTLLGYEIIHDTTEKS